MILLSTTSTQMNNKNSLVSKVQKCSNWILTGIIAFQNFERGWFEFLYIALKIFIATADFKLDSVARVRRMYASKITTTSAIINEIKTKVGRDSLRQIKNVTEMMMSNKLMKPMEQGRLQICLKAISDTLISIYLDSSLKWVSTSTTNSSLPGSLKNHKLDKH